MRSSDIEHLLPDVVRRTRTPGGALDALLAAMEQLHAPTEALLDDFERHVDPYRCPEDFVAYLASWVGLDWLLSGHDTRLPTGDGPLRDLVALAPHLAAVRGTAEGLTAMLETAIGSPGVVVQVADAHPFHIVVRCPEAARMYHDLVSSITRHEKPAFVTADVAFGDDEPVRLGRIDDTRPTATTSTPRPGEESHA